MESHNRSGYHQKRSKEVTQRVNTVLAIRDAPEELPSVVKKSLSPHGPFQNQIFGLIGRLTMEENRGFISTAKMALPWYQQLERISLLELAAWKFACATLDEASHSKSGVSPRTCLEWNRWFENGWKTQKKSHYRCNQVVIIMKSVVPFVKDMKVMKPKF